MTANLVAGRYRLEEHLSSTTMADVWVASDSVLERRVVVKLLAADADRPRFEREARAAATLAHPNIVQLYDYGEDQGRPYMVLEYLPAGTLADRLRDGGALPDDDTRRIATDVAAGLAHAHLHGVVHRDLKAGNVLFDEEERAKVGDFGIAYVQGTDTLTETGTVLGTAAYISPEQVSGGPVTPATDVYAFGVLFYRMLTGRFPFESESALELARKHRDEDPPPLRTVRPDAPADLAALAMAALSKAPSARPPDGTALLASLERTGPPVSVGDAPTARLRTVAPRRRRIAYVLAGTLLGVAGLVTALIVLDSHSSSPAVSSRAHVSSTRRQTSTTTTPSLPTTNAATQGTSTQPTTSPAPPTTTAPAPPVTTPSTTAPTTTAPTTPGP